MHDESVTHEICTSSISRFQIPRLKIATPYTMCYLSRSKTSGQTICAALARMFHESVSRDREDGLATERHRVLSPRRT